MKLVQLITEAEKDKEHLQKMADTFSKNIAAGKVASAIVIWIEADGSLNVSRCFKDDPALIGTLFAVATHHAEACYKEITPS